MAAKRHNTVRNLLHTGRSAAHAAKLRRDSEYKSGIWHSVVPQAPMPRSDCYPTRVSALSRLAVIRSIEDSRLGLPQSGQSFAWRLRAVLPRYTPVEKSGRVGGIGLFAGDPDDEATNVIIPV